jgi:hypothetical protein
MLHRVGVMSMFRFKKKMRANMKLETKMRVVLQLTLPIVTSDVTPSKL